MTTAPRSEIEVVPNPATERPYRVRMVAPEFTCLCPKTGQPDFATIVVEYVPGPLLIELKSLKLYLWSWREQGAFHEAIVNQLLADFVAMAQPRWMSVTGYFRVRGGITTTVVAQHGIVPRDLPEFAAPPRSEES
jgi:7-cyano-7-deazaguanine reductase